MGEPKDIKEGIREKAAALGFDAVGFCAATAGDDDQCNLAAFLDQGRHGTMTWMAETSARRADPRTLWPEAKSVVVLAVNYGPATDPLAALERRGRGAVSVYAHGADYHDVVKKRLKKLARWMVESHGGDVKVFVDTAPIMEKPLARRAGIGWQGKHTNLVSRAFGSWLFLGEVFTTLDLSPDTPATDHCGSCQRCLDACPTGALTAPYRIDARRCISYLTIEHKGDIPAPLAAAMGNRIYGCDDCLAVCPWNKFAVPTGEAAFLPRAELAAPRLADLARLDDRAFRQVFAGSPVKRSGRDRIVRNVLVAIANSGDGSLLESVVRGVDDASPWVRRAARWALAKLAA
jgi:epoxyqueuosine reductase